MAIVEEVRPKWWKFIVLILEVLIPTIFAIAGLIAPLTVYLDGYEAEHKKDTLHIQDELRGEACGTMLGAIVAFFAATTKKLDVLIVCNFCLLVETGLFLSYYILMWIVDGFCDLMGIIVVGMMLLLNMYMLYKIQKYQREAGDEAVSLLV